MAGEGVQRRRRENAMFARRHAHQVKVSPAEEAMLKQLALAHQVTIPRLLVESTFELAKMAQDEQQRPMTVAERNKVLRSLFELHRLVGNVANNVNQIAKATNTTHEWQAGTAQTLAAVRSTCGHITEAIDRVAAR